MTSPYLPSPVFSVFRDYLLFFLYFLDFYFCIPKTSHAFFLFPRPSSVFFRHFTSAIADIFTSRLGFFLYFLNNSFIFRIFQTLSWICYTFKTASCVYVLYALDYLLSFLLIPDHLLYILFFFVLYYLNDPLRFLCSIYNIPVLYIFLRPFPVFSIFSNPSPVFLDFLISPCFLLSFSQPSSGYLLFKDHFLLFLYLHRTPLVFSAYPGLSPVSLEHFLNVQYRTSQRNSFVFSNTHETFS